MQVPEQRCRTGSPGHQTHHETDAGLQGFSVRAHHFVRHRGHAYDSERTDAGKKRHPPVSRRAVLLAGDVSNPDYIDQARPSTVIATEPRFTPTRVLGNVGNHAPVEIQVTARLSAPF